MTRFILAGLLLTLLVSLPIVAFAADAPETDEPPKDDDAPMSLGTGIALLGAGLAIGLAALGTGVAQSRIGSAGLGVIAEDPKKLGFVLMLVAIPETLVVFGFLIAILIMGK